MVVMTDHNLSGLNGAIVAAVGWPYQAVKHNLRAVRRFGWPFEGSSV
jgi:hypothetical protein